MTFAIVWLGRGWDDNFDRIDIVLFAYDISDGSLANLSTALSAAGFRGRRFVSFEVHERSQNADFNFDGDVFDHVLGVYDSELDTFHNTAQGNDNAVDHIGARLIEN